MLLNKPNFSNRFYYHAHGITFDSSVELEELTPISASELGELPVTLNIGKTPKKLKTIIAKGERFQLSENEFLLPIDQIATFWVKNGTTPTLDAWLRWEVPKASLMNTSPCFANCSEKEGSFSVSPL